MSALRQLPYVEIANCFVVSTGHGPSGPFVFGGARLTDLLRDVLGRHERWRTVEVMGGDGFRARLRNDELLHEKGMPIALLAYRLDGRPLTRQEGLVRLIVPGERDDALRQVKWVSLMRIIAA